MCDLYVRQPQALDKVGGAHEGAVRAPIRRRFVNDKSALVPRQVKVELKRHRQLNVVDSTDLKDPNVDVDVEGALGVWYNILKHFH